MSAYPHDPQQQPPVHGGWEQPWQDATGQWHYPYSVQGTGTAPAWSAPAPVVPQPQPQPQQPTFVAPEQLAPVGPPLYAAPTAAPRDPRRTALASTITFLCLIVALWAILGFLDSIATTLASVSSGTEQVKTQLKTANEGLAGLDAKTGSLNDVADDAGALNDLLTGINGDMGEMLAGVDRINTSMTAMDGSLITLEQQLDEVNATNGRMSTQLGALGEGLRTQQKNVGGMRRDVVATKGTLGQLSPSLDATNARLGHVNSVVNVMGCTGIGNNLSIKIRWTFITAGSATIKATMIPAGAWGKRADGSNC